MEVVSLIFFVAFAAAAFAGVVMLVQGKRPW